MSETRGPSLKEHVTRDLVPLVRQALVDEPAEVLRDEASIAAAFAPTSSEDEWGYGRIVQTEALNMLDEAWFADVVSPLPWPDTGELQPHSPGDWRADLLAAFDKMLAPSLVPAWRRPRTGPIYLTREQIDQLPRAQADEFLPWNPARSLLAGLPVVEVVTVEESTPHREGWLLTLVQIIQGVQVAASEHLRWSTTPLHMTHPQMLRVMAITGQTPPDGWEQTLDRGGEISQICGRPVFLADRAEDSTPCIERWMDL